MKYKINNINLTFWFEVKWNDILKNIINLILILFGLLNKNFYILNLKSILLRILLFL
jgi:hypothetical protein